LNFECTSKPQFKEKDIRMDVQVTRENAILVKAEVSLPWEKVSGLYTKALNNIRQNASVPGFRKGKAPASVLKKRYQNEIKEELARQAIPDSMPTWIEEQDFELAGQPRLISFDVEIEGPLTYSVFVDVMPDIELKEWRGVEAEKKNTNVTDEEVEETLERRLKSSATHEHVKDRALADGDTVTLQLTVMDAESNEVLTDEEDYKVTIGGEGSHALIADNLKGTEIGETVQFTETIEGDKHFPEWDGKTVKVILDAKDAVVHNQPELNDEWAKTQDDATSLDDLRNKVREQIQKAREEQEEQASKGRLIGKIVGEYNFEVPIPAVVEEAKQMVEQQLMPYMQAMPQGLDENMMNSMVQHMIQPATEKVRTDIVLSHIAKAEGIVISDEEVEKEIKEHAESMKRDAEELMNLYRERGALDEFKKHLGRRKAMELVAESATFKVVDKLTEEIEAEKAAQAQAEAEAKAAESGEEAASESEGEAKSEG
jgi:trigger factor